MREVAAEFERPVLLFSGGKDSICLLRLAEKAFRPSDIPMPFLNIETGHEFPELIQFRDHRAKELEAKLIVRSVDDAIKKGLAMQAPGEISRNKLQTPALLGAIEESALDDVERMFDTNVFGLLRVTQAVLPIMRAQKAGYIMNLSSAAGVVATAGFGMYNGTKFAVEGLSQALAQEVKHLGINVTIIEPGPFRTDFADRSISMQPPIADYEESVGKTRTFLESIAGKQAGDPVKAARVMIDLASQANPPLQVPLGHSAIDRIKARSAQWKDEMERAEQLARTADYDDSKAA